jgi:TetR/AcrR family transcriptional regulator, mexJK operon transcriptional repressor
MSTSAPRPHLDPPAGSRAERKRAAILDAAGRVFLANGYLGTSMDEIASVAAVSKQTVYKHFSDKAALFSELITTTVQATGDPGADQPDLSGDRPVDQALATYARHLLHGVMQPHVLGLRRLVIAEAARFPDLGARFYELGPARTVEVLTRTMAKLSEDGQLAIDDARLAAEHFIWLVLSIPLNRAMLLGEKHGIRHEDLDYYANAGTSTFLAAFAPTVEHNRTNNKNRSHPNTRPHR